MTSGIKITIPGRPPAKSNSYRIVSIKGRPALVPTKEVKAYEELIRATSSDYVDLLGGLRPLFPAPISVELILVWHRADRRRKDLDNIAKAIKDGLTKGQIWSDDSQVDTLLLHWTFDAVGVANEWVDIYIRPTSLPPSTSPGTRTTGSNASATSTAPAAPSASVPATPSARSGTTRRSAARSASGAGSDTLNAERTAHSPKTN